MVISSGGDHLSRGIGPKDHGKGSDVGEGKAGKLGAPAEELKAHLSPHQFEQLTKAVQSGLLADALEDVAEDIEDPEEKKEDSKKTKGSKNRGKGSKSGGDSTKFRGVERQVSSRKQVANKETNKSKEKSETPIKSDAKIIKEQKAESKEKDKPASIKENKGKEGAEKQGVRKQSESSSSKPTLKEQMPQEKATLKISTKEEIPHTKEAKELKETVVKEAPEAKNDSKEKASVAPKARSKESGKEETSSSVKEEVKSQPKEELKAVKPDVMKQAKKSEKTEQKAPLEKTAKDTSTNKKHTEDARVKAKSENLQEVKTKQALPKAALKQGNPQKSKKTADAQSKQSSVKPRNQADPKTLQKGAAVKMPPGQTGSQKGATTEHTQSQAQSQAGAQIQSSKLQNYETSLKSKAGPSDDLGLKSSQVVDGSTDKGGDTGDSSRDQGQNSEKEPSNEDSKEKSSEDKDVHKSWSNQGTTVSLHDEVDSFHDVVAGKHANHEESFLRIAAGIQEDDSPDIVNDPVASTQQNIPNENGMMKRGGSPHGSRKVVSPSGQGDNADPSNSEDEFFIFSRAYNLSSSDSMGAQIAGNIASYLANKATNDWAAKRHLLENLAREYSGFVRDYMSGVRGYQLHICDGTFHFTSDMTPNNPTSRYSDYLSQVQKYQDDYLIAKNNLWSFDPVYNGAVGNYHSMYDSYQLILNLDESILSGINNIGSNLLEKEIKAAEKEGFSEQQAVKKVLESMLSSVAGEIGSVENSIKTAKEPQKSADEKELKTLKALKGNINSLNTSMTHALNAGGNVSLSSMKGTMGKIGSGLAALKTEDKSFEEGLSLKLTSMEDNLRKHDGSLASAARETAQLKANVERFYKYALPKIESALKRVSSDNSTYGKSISLSTIIKSGVNKGKHEIIDPFTDTSEIIQEIEKQLNGVKNASTTGGMVNLLNKFQMSIGSTLHNLKQSDTGHFKEAYEKAKNAYESAIISKRDYLSKVGTTSTQYFNYIKNNEVPIGERFSSVSEYGYAMDFLNQYKRVAACVELTGSNFNALSNTAFAKPHKVNASLISEWWETKNNFHDQYEDTKGDIPLAIAAVSVAALWAASACGVNLLADAAVAAAAVYLANLKSDEKTENNEYLQATQVYNQYSHSLPAMQHSKDTLWKKRLGTESGKIAQEIEKKITDTKHKEKEAEKRLHRESSNVEKVLKTITSIVERQKKAAKTESYLS